MKNYIIAFLAICVVVVLSFVYKHSQNQVLVEFPIEHTLENGKNREPRLFLFIFFSRHNCPTCLEAIEVLNALPPQFVVTGIVPDEELENETDVRNTTGAAFKLISAKGTYKRFLPHYTPTIFGVAGNGKILFVLPGTAGAKAYLYDFLTNFYGKCIELLLPVQ